ncbi:MAG: isoprenyl transferase [Pseudomonadota bacterium]
MNAPGARADAPAVEGGGVPRPKHVAIVMDGNGRWAAARGLPRSAGHREGVEAARRAVEAARALSLTHLTLYSFSTENWRRPAGEIRDLMGLLKQFIIDDLPRLKREKVCVRIIGDRENLDMELRALVRRAESETRNNDAFYLQIAFNYGGRDEIARAARALAADVRDGKVDPQQIDEARVGQYLDTTDAPDPDLVIRTSGEMRISNFLLWQAAYAEYMFLDVLWPDFTAEVFETAVNEYCQRERRYGGLGAASG